VEPTPDYAALLKALVDRANSGDGDALARLRRFLDSNPHIWRQVGDLNTVTERAWIELMAERNQLLAESVRRNLGAMKSELAGPRPTALEALLVDQVGIAWLALHYAELQAASPPGSSLDQAAFKLRRAESSQKRLLSAAKTLVTLRALLPAGLVPLNHLSVRQEDKASA
jgi:hypothetical protein